MQIYEKAQTNAEGKGKLTRTCEFGCVHNLIAI